MVKFNEMLSKKKPSISMRSYQCSCIALLCQLIWAQHCNAIMTQFPYPIKKLHNSVQPWLLLYNTEFLSDHCLSVLLNSVFPKDQLGLHFKFFNFFQPKGTVVRKIYSLEEQKVQQAVCTSGKQSRTRCSMTASGTL